jgi:phytanoyl-CoA hydroxylase
MSAMAFPHDVSMKRSSIEKEFAEFGYCIVPNLYTESELREIESFFEEYKTSGGTTFDAGSSYEEIDITKRQVRAMHPHRYSEKAKAWLLNPNVAEVLAWLLGKEALAVQSMYYFKPPGAKGQGMHQDNFYLLAKPATCIGAWTAIDDADLENGCLWVVPGSNQGDLHCPDKSIAERWMNYGDSHITKFPRDQKPVPVEVPRGATFFFSGNLIHGSGPNRTKDRSRRTFIGHYIDESSQQVAQFYHPVLNMRGGTVTSLDIPSGGGPCGDGWLGATH